MTVVPKLCVAMVLSAGARFALLALVSLPPHVAALRDSFGADSSLASWEDGKQVTTAPGETWLTEESKSFRRGGGTQLVVDSVEGFCKDDKVIISHGRSGKKTDTCTIKMIAVSMTGPPYMVLIEDKGSSYPKGATVKKAAAAEKPSAGAAVALKPTAGAAVAPQKWPTMPVPKPRGPPDEDVDDFWEKRYNHPVLRDHWYNTKTDEIRYGDTKPRSTKKKAFSRSLQLQSSSEGTRGLEGSDQPDSTRGFVAGGRVEQDGGAQPYEVPSVGGKRRQDPRKDVTVKHTSTLLYQNEVRYPHKDFAKSKKVVIGVGDGGQISEQDADCILINFERAGVHWVSEYDYGNLDFAPGKDPRRPGAPVPQLRKVDVRKCQEVMIKSSRDGQWYRAKVVEVYENKFDAWYVDREYTKRGIPKDTANVKILKAFYELPPGWDCEVVQMRGNGRTRYVNTLLSPDVTGRYSWYEPLQVEFKALWDFVGDAGDNELTFQARDILDIAWVQGANWGVGRKQDGTVGLVPMNYVQPKDIKVE